MWILILRKESVTGVDKRNTVLLMEAIVHLARVPTLLKHRELCTLTPTTEGKLMMSRFKADLECYVYS